MSTNFFLNIKKLSDNAIIPTFANAAESPRSGSPNMGEQHNDSEETSELYASRETIADDVGIDLHTTINHTFRPGTWAPIPTGLWFEFAGGHVGWIVPDIELVYQQGLTVFNSPGKIQSGDRGEILVLLVNHSDREVMVEAGQKIAQIVFMPIVQTLNIQSNTKIVTELTDLDHREGTFSSSLLAQNVAKNVNAAVEKFFSELANIDNYVRPDWELEIKQEIWDRFEIDTLPMQSMFDSEVAKIRTPSQCSSAR